MCYGKIYCCIDCVQPIKRRVVLFVCFLIVHCSYCARIAVCKVHNCAIFLFVYFQSVPTNLLKSNKKKFLFFNFLRFNFVMSDNPSNQRKMKAKAKKPANRVNINNNVIKKPIKSQQKLEAGKKVRVGKSKTKITDLNDHCLATIFNNLSLEDLVKVAASNTRFTVASRLAFVEKHAKDTITVSNEYKSKTDKELSSVHLIRHFGHLINKLKVEYADDHHRFNQQLEYAISKHCHKTLVELELENFDKFVFHRIIRPFKAVKTVRFVEGVLGEFHMNLRKWFPNAVNLDFVEPNIQEDRYAKCIERKMPNLEHLGVFNVVRPDEGFDYRYADEDEIEALGEIP